MGILEVHSRDKKLEDNVNFQKVARATAGFTGAELMNLMNTAAVEAVRQGRDRVTEPDIFEVRSQMLMVSCTMFWVNLLKHIPDMFAMVFMLLQAQTEPKPSQHHCTAHAHALVQKTMASNRQKLPVFFRPAQDKICGHQLSDALRWKQQQRLHLLGCAETPVVEYV